MESGLILIFGIGIVSLLVLYLINILDKEHFFFKLLLLFFLFPLLTFIGKAAIDYQNYCDVVVSTTNETSTGYIEYSYDRVCFENPYNTSNDFFKALTWLGRFFYGYVFLYLNYDFWLKKWVFKWSKKFRRNK